MDVASFMGLGGCKVHCLFPSCPGNKVGSSVGEQCILADQWNLCVCMHDVFVCVDRSGEAAIDDDKRGQREKKEWWVIRWCRLRVPS